MDMNIFKRQRTKEDWYKIICGSGAICLLVALIPPYGKHTAIFVFLGVVNIFNGWRGLQKGSLEVISSAPINVGPSPDLKIKLAIVRKRHNRVAIMALVIFISSFFGFIRFVPYSPVTSGFALALFVAATIIYIRWFWLYDGRLCKEEGLICPYCAGPLYQGGANSFSLFGNCPKCKRSVVNA